MIVFLSCLAYCRILFLLFSPPNIACNQLFRHDQKKTDDGLAFPGIFFFFSPFFSDSPAPPRDSERSPEKGHDKKRALKKPLQLNLKTRTTERNVWSSIDLAIPTTYVHLLLPKVLISKPLIQEEEERVRAIIDLSIESRRQKRPRQTKNGSLIV